ncbi:MAG: plasmid partitioning protein RepB C-terminal domain-containing protein [Janthinobacterium lividum]
MTTGKRVKRAFEAEVLSIPLATIEPSKTIAQKVKRSVKFARIAASIAEVGLVEPLVVSREPSGRFRLLDGHARLAALLQTGAADARCLVALDDEAFTYNKRISHLATIQEHYMIIKALDKGASEARIAASLNLDVAAIRKRRAMLDGICPEVVDLLKSKSVNIGVFSALRRMRALRQIEAVELMMAAGNVTAGYAKVLLAGTRQVDLVNPEKIRKAAGLKPDQLERMQREMEAVQTDFKAVEKTFGSNVLELVVATGYLGRLIKNHHVQVYLEEKHPEYLVQFKSIVRTTSLDQNQPT